MSQDKTPSSTTKLVARASVIAAARAKLSRPWKLYGRSDHLDCGGLLITVANETSLEDNFEFLDYPELPKGREIRDLLERLCGTPLTVNDLSVAKEADILLIKDFDLKANAWYECHTAWLSKHPAMPKQWMMIHAYAIARRVVEHMIDDEWHNRIVAIFRHPRLEP